MIRTTCIAFILSVAALATAPHTAHAELRVVATVPDLAAIAKEIGGSEVSVTALALPTQDPHWVDAKPSLALHVNKADLLLAVGVELEVGWLPTLQKSARNAKVLRSGSGFLECSSFVKLLDVPTGRIDRSMGDVHPGGNPHYLYDPRRVLRCARAVSDRMAQLDPGNANTYRANTQRFVKNLEALREKWEKRMAPYRGAKLVTYHKSWTYLTDWLELDVIETIEPKPGIAPSPRHVARVIKRARASKVKLILQESYYPGRTGKLVASKVGVRLVRLQAAANFQAGESFLVYLDTMLARLERELKG